VNLKQNSSSISLLFVGCGTIGSNSLSLFAGFQSTVKHSVLIDTSFFDSPGRYSIRRILRRISPVLYGVFASGCISLKLQKELRKSRQNLVVVFKGNYVSRATLNRITALKVHYHPDDSSNPVNRTKIFSKAEKHYDLHFTSKRHNISEIFERTGKSVFFMWYAYDEKWHFRISPVTFTSPIYRIGFFGHMRPDRTGLILEIAQKFGKEFAVTGEKWGKVKGLTRLADVKTATYGIALSSFVASAPLQLGLLNSDNRDQHTARSFEIPAMGGLLLAEDTEEHREIFGPKGNVLYFENPAQLFEQIAWVYSNPELAKKIAENGYIHITRNPNTWKDRSIEILTIVANFEV
jgi:hypothetical protein